jgi:hypothetical protein
MKQALKQSFALLLKTTLPTGLLSSLVIYLLRWVLFYDNSFSFTEEISLFSLIVVAACCTTYVATFLIQSIRLGMQKLW